MLGGRTAGGGTDTATLFGPATRCPGPHVVDMLDTDIFLAIGGGAVAEELCPCIRGAAIAFTGPETLGVNGASEEVILADDLDFS